MSFSVQKLEVRRAKQTVLQDVNFTLLPGQITGLIGPNGVGKSSLLKSMAGIMNSSGSVTYKDRELSQADRRRVVSYMPQDSSAGSSLTLTEVVLLGRLNTLGMRVSPDLISSVHRALQDFGLEHLAGRTLDAVSGGQRQLCYLAQALFREPQVLMLDEPTAALDLRHQLIVFETLRKLARSRQIAVIVAMHDLSLAAQFCDRIACLNKRKLDAYGPPQEVLTAERLGRVYGIETEVTNVGPEHLQIRAVRAL